MVKQAARVSKPLSIVVGFSSVADEAPTEPVDAHKARSGNGDYGKVDAAVVATQRLLVEIGLRSQNKGVLC
jgi:hypothetical protein